jgi:hypothetical protein
MTYRYYAGFTYIVTPNGLVPAPGQHPAAGKAKHIRAAEECGTDKPDEVDDDET